MASSAICDGNNDSIVCRMLSILEGWLPAVSEAGDVTVPGVSPLSSSWKRLRIELSNKLSTGAFPRRQPGDDTEDDPAGVGGASSARNSVNVLAASFSVSFALELSEVPPVLPNLVAIDCKAVSSSATLCWRFRLLSDPGVLIVELACCS